MSRVLFSAVALLSVALAVQPAIETIALPDAAAFPEGIAHDVARGAIYTASAETGAVVRVNLNSRAVSTVAAAGVLFPAGSNPAFPAALGMKLDAENRLWIAGGRTGKMFVLNTITGALIQQFEVPNPTGSLINDVAIAGSAAYFTDTRAATLWRIPFTNTSAGPLEAWRSFDGTALKYDPNANNLNGIAATADGKTLIVVQMAAGLLFKIDVASKAVTAIATRNADLSGADGLVLDGRTLYVVRQTAVEIARVDLAADLASGVVSARLKDPLLAWPATAIKVGDRLIVVNTQFNTRANNAAVRPFTLASVPVARLAPGR